VFATFRCKQLVVCVGFLTVFNVVEIIDDDLGLGLDVVFVIIKDDVIVSISKCMEPCAFWERDVLTFVFIGILFPFVNVLSHKIFEGDCMSWFASNVVVFFGHSSAER